jgi:hypothetical protein
MTTRHDSRAGIHDDAPGHGKPSPGSGHGGHGWMMIACCVPMLVIAVILLATGVVGIGFLAVAVGCTLMMALMMRGMSHGGDQS